MMNHPALAPVMKDMQKDEHIVSYIMNGVAFSL